MKMSRREFLIVGTAFVGSFFIGGPLLYAGVKELENVPMHKSPRQPSLVIVQLSGGNDGINTVIPYELGAYYDARPTLRLLEQEVVPIGGGLGFHPSLSGLQRLYGKGKLAIIQGVGYPKPDHSHFRSMDIWQTAEPEKMIQSGWLGRFLESKHNPLHPLFAVQIGGEGANKAFDSKSIGVPVIQTLDNFDIHSSRVRLAKEEKARLNQVFVDMYQPNNQPVGIQVAAKNGKQAYDTIRAIQSIPAISSGRTTYPKSGFARDLQTVVKLLAGQAESRIFYTQTGGFDDHANEKSQHATVLKNLDESLAAFYNDLEERGLHESVVTVIFSEFGRRVRENNSGGTDHGTAGPMFVLGGKVKGGLYGQYPSLSDLISGDLKYEVDFRSVYFTLIDKWLQGDAKSVLGMSYETLDFI